MVGDYNQRRVSDLKKCWGMEGLCVVCISRSITRNASLYELSVEKCLMRLLIFAVDLLHMAGGMAWGVRRISW